MTKKYAWNKKQWGSCVLKAANLLELLVWRALAIYHVIRVIIREN